MRARIQFVAVLVVGLGLLTFVAYEVMTRTTRAWFDADIALRARLAVASARQSLTSHWASDRAEGLADVLTDITRDKRIMAAAACDTGGRLRAATADYPNEFSCASLLDAMRRDGLDPASSNDWAMDGQLPDGRVRLSVLRITSSGRALGTVVLVHDLSFVERRETTTRNQVLIAFFILSLAASAITFIAARFARRGWLRELRLALSGGSARGPREFQPLLRDVRDLVERLSLERENEVAGGRWTPERLKSALVQHLHGERLVILANREPYIHERSASGQIQVLHPASGMVSALEPVMRACSGVWVAHGSGSADRETADADGRVNVPPGEGSYVVRRVWLTEEEETGYYYGFSNEGLWPLCHVAHTRPVFRTEDWEQYQLVNRKFADAVCAEVDVEDPIIFVQDYHFALAPRMIRERLPRATILAFWHVPWPNSEHFGICPWRNEIIQGLLGASILGFQTQQHCNNFLDGVDAFVESRIDRETNAVIQQDRRTLIRPYPISIEWPVHWLNELPDAATCRAEIRERFGLREGTLLGVGVDRLDYTKGIEERLLAVDEMLARNPEFRGRFTFIQLAAPSRTRIERYRELGERVQALARTINEKWGSDGYWPIIVHHAHHEPASVFRYLRAADLCFVSSLHDGMNLVAKEFVAAREDGLGVLVLSQFTGAARELTEALMVNPYDRRQSASALAAALRMPPREQRERMLAMRGLVAELNVYRWAGRILVDAAQLRRRERLTGRLAGTRASAIVLETS